MFALVTDKSRFFRIKRGQSGEEVEKTLSCPTAGEAFAGRIIQTDIQCFAYIAKPGDDYRSLAEKFGVDEEELRKLNGDKCVYPTRKLFVPCKKNGCGIL